MADNQAGNPFLTKYVVKACQTAYKRLTESRLKREEGLIAKLMEPRPRFWFFGKPVHRTREQAVAKLESDDRVDLWFARNMHSSQLTAVCEILSVASNQVQTDETMLTREEFGYIKTYYKE